MYNIYIHCICVNVMYSHILHICPQTHVARVSRQDKVNALLSSALEKIHYKCFLERYSLKPTGLIKLDIISCREA